jgi:hypothetical protein
MADAETETDTEAPKRQRRPSAPSQIDFVFERMAALRGYAQRFARAIEEHVPDGITRDQALRAVQDALLHALEAPPPRDPMDLAQKLRDLERERHE